jgi:hypothetical protein
MKRKQIALILLAALMALSAASVTSAQPPNRTPGEGQPNGEGRGPRGEHRRPRPVLHGVRHIVMSVGEATGLTPREIVALLAEGNTLAQVIADNGGDVGAVRADILAPLQERVAAAVENGRITQARGDELLATAAERLDEMLNRVFERLTERERPIRRRLQGENEV